MKKIFVVFLFIGLGQIKAQYISTIGGNGTMAYTGDGGLATAASLNKPYGVTFDTSGNLYIADEGNHCVRMIAAGTGIITTVAGTGTAGYSGDGGLATAADLDSPTSIAFDPSGNMYIVDFANSCVRKVTLGTGIITTIAGTGNAAFSGDGGLATLAELRYPADLKIDTAGNIFIADTYNNRVRKIDATTGIITTVAGNGSTVASGDGGQATAAGFYYPFGIMLDSHNNIYISATDNSQVRKIDGTTGIISTVINKPHITGFGGDGGPALTAMIDGPYGITIDANDNIYFCDYANHRIRRIDAVTGIISTVAGFGGGIFSGDGGLAVNAGVGDPTGLAFDQAGNLYFAQFNDNRVRRVTVTNNYISGYVFVDVNADCVKDNGEPLLINRTVQLDPGPYFATTDSSGFYSFSVDTGTYTVKLIPPNYLTQLCPASDYTIALPTKYDSAFSKNFSEQVASSCPDLSVTMATTALRPCFQNTYALNYCNLGMDTATGVLLNLQVPDTSIILLSSSVPWIFVSNVQYQFAIDTLLPNECGTIYITDSVSCNAVIGSVKCMNLQIFPYVGDCYAHNNSIDNCQRVIVSHDPNSKQVASQNFSSNGFVDGELISATDTLSYVIHFQNTGTDTAFNVIVRDVLPAELDIASVQNGASSHPCTFKIFGQGVIEWSFKNILLPDSGANQLASNGFVSFTVNQKTGNAPGTNIDNYAKIIFDFNTAVYTNDCIDTVFAFATFAGGKRAIDYPVKIFPNPASNSVIIESNAAPGLISVYNALGEIVLQTFSTENRTWLDISVLRSGMYIIEVGQTRLKLLKE